MILVLSVILFVLLAIISRGRGVKAFLSLYINYGFIAFAAILICFGVDPVVMAIILSLGASALILFFINGVNIKTQVSYVSIIIVLCITTALILWAGNTGNIGGFDVQYKEDIFFTFPVNIHINFTQVAIAVILMSFTGAITDIALDITTALNEVHENNKGLSFLELAKSGLHIAGDVLGTMINTLFFVFIAEFMGFIILYSVDRDFGTILNNNLFLQAISKLLIGNLGCILIVPVTILIQSAVYTRGTHAKTEGTNGE